MLINYQKQISKIRKENKLLQDNFDKTLDMCQNQNKKNSENN